MGREIVERGISHDTSIGDFRRYKVWMLGNISDSLRQDCTLFIPQRHVLRSLYERFELFFSHEGKKCTTKSLQFCFDVETLLQLLEREAPSGDRSTDNGAIFRELLNKILRDSPFSKTVLGILGGKKGIQEYADAADYWKGEEPQLLLKTRIRKITDNT